jgi:hypothetical protein
MGLPMDNPIFRIFLQSWPVILAAIATVLLIYHWFRPKFSLEKLQKGLVRQSVLMLVGEAEQEGAEGDPEQQTWLAAREQIQEHFQTKLQDPAAPPRIRYRNYLSISLVWTLFWCGAFAFLTIRMLIAPFYYGSEAIFLGYFAYYILLGLISYFKR